MGKLNQLLGVANNLANSFVSVTNFHFLKHMRSLSVEKINLFEINLLKETIKPEDLMSKTVKNTITQYKMVFFRN
jgi:ribosomal protein S13